MLTWNDMVSILCCPDSVFCLNLLAVSGLNAQCSDNHTGKYVCLCSKYLYRENVLKPLSSVSLLPTSEKTGRPAIRRFMSASLIRDVGLTDRKVQIELHAHSRNL